MDRSRKSYNLAAIGVVSALWVRKVVRPKRFEGSHLGEADGILAMIATIVISLLLWHATRIALGYNEWPASWSPIVRGSPRRTAG